MSENVDITCPCCSTVLTVDVRTGKVLKRVEVRELDEAGRPKVDTDRWTSAAERVRERSGKETDKLSDALSRERERRSSLDDRFKEAQDRAAKEPEED